MLYIIRGLPGSGKSTLAKTMAYALDARHFEADMYHINGDGDYIWNPKNTKIAHEWCQAAVKNALQDGADVIVSNTFTQMWEMRPYLDMGFPVTVIHCEGSFGNIHGVPEYAVDRMRARWENYCQ